MVNNFQLVSVVFYSKVTQTEGKRAFVRNYLSVVDKYTFGTLVSEDLVKNKQCVLMSVVYCGLFIVVVEKKDDLTKSSKRHSWTSGTFNEDNRKCLFIDCQGNYHYRLRLTSTCSHNTALFFSVEWYPFLLGRLRKHPGY